MDFVTRKFSQRKASTFTRWTDRNFSDRRQSQSKRRSFSWFGFKQIYFQVEFIRGLIELAVVKVDSQLTSILCEKQLFTHYIEEILKFSQRLFEEDIDYPKSLPNCMNLLCEEIIFEKWFQVEQDGESKT